MDEHAKNGNPDMRRSFGTNDVTTSGGKSNSSNLLNTNAVFEEGTFITKDPALENGNSLVESAAKNTNNVA